MKQLATSNLEFQQTMNFNNMQFQQNLNAMIQDLKTHVSQLANTVGWIHPIVVPKLNSLGKKVRKVEINIPLLDVIKQIPKYAKFLKELCVHKRRKMKGKGGVELSGIVSALTKNEAVIGSTLSLPKKCRDPEIFSVPCTIKTSQ
ncbi:hypothetical protein CR513_45936, partial [Mucuna pruriens]